ncbi:hypothetical protein, partial [Pseudomonas sp. Sample_9]|uniref:hypothetical protein n=1 Tax=Pseudomonas sp. Sample_9 TaxID=2382158 RepID=UPI0019D5AD6C
RESAVSGNDDVECAAAFASKLAPTGFWLSIQNRDKSKGCIFGPKADILRFTLVREPISLYGQPLPG